MKKIRIVLLVLISVLFSAGSIFSQSKVPGYMGKRILFGYKYHLMPGWGKEPSKNQEFSNDQSASFKINSFHEGFVEAAIGRRSTILVKALFSNAQFSQDESDNYYYNGYQSLSTEWGRYSSYGGALGLRLFNKHIAPLGAYIGASMGWQQVKIESFTQLVKVDYNSPWRTQVIEPASGGTIFVGFEFGTNHIMFDQLIVNFSLESNLFLSSLVNLATRYDDYGQFNVDEYQDELVSSALFRMQKQQIISVGIGIGFLP